LLDMVLAIYDSCLGLLERGVAASAIEECDLGVVLRARETVDPDDGGGVRAIADAALRELEQLQ
jgi:hypothetical protein